MDNEKKPKIARVLVDLSLNRYFDYNIPKELEKKISIGTHVIVPFGKSKNKERKIYGCVIAFPSSSSYPNLKLIESVYIRRPRIPVSLLKLGEWMAEYYCCSKEQAVRALLPGPVRSGRISKKNITYFYLPDPKKASEFLFDECKNSPSKARVIKELLQKPDLPLFLLKKITGSSNAVINSLVKKNILAKENRTVMRDPFSDSEILREEKPEHTEEQSIVLAEIKKMLNGELKYFCALLYGVTGSGKTEVYLQAIEEILDKGKEAIVLVPEISLTPQTTERFRGRFGNSISVLHSGLSDGERYDEWTKIYEGKVKIVVGARSALFAPFKNLGLIIVDEEHENSYKQDEVPRYHARDVAVMRAYREKASVILGSATPSLESFYNVEKKKYLLLKLTKRIDDRIMPKMLTVDMRAQAVSAAGASIFSKDLVAAVYDRVERGEQTIIFLNRRGYATHMSCIHCGYVAGCPECSVDYTYHRAKGYLSCHICGSVIKAPQHCPSCKAPDIKYLGVGTEKIEAIAGKLFPLARVKRMDSDTMTHKKSYETVLRSFRKGDIDILIGTQMIAKGLDFPNVTLVGIINADISLHIPDFRSGERTFQLLTQVAGRAGRGNIPGEVYIQTYTPFNSAIQYAVNHDYDGFYKEEIEIRKQLGYPPEGHLAIVRFTGENEEKVIETAELFAKDLEPLTSDKLMISLVCPAPISRMKKKYRYMLMIRGNINSRLKKYLNELIFHRYTSNTVYVYVDIDAVNQM
jgi:primosomal protein N' (replication factor Y) (superfamily II helicase)